jgi:hypothetical protein
MIDTVKLEQLRCNQQNQSGGARPYLWVQLLAIDDDTLTSGVGVARVDFLPPPDGAQVTIATNMRAGDTALLPNPVSHLTARFRDGLTRRDLLLVAVLWDQQDTPATQSWRVTAPF